MANRFGPDILIQAPDPKKAALFYVNHLGFEITDNNDRCFGPNRDGEPMVGNPEVLTRVAVPSE
jgi:hypothetical protein